jgi:Dolichyl-phosphate-mannose-protein mannosyltransferase
MCMSFLSKVRSVDKYFATLFLMALIFFGIYSYLAFSTSNIGINSNELIFNSPDETANFWAAKTFYATGSFTQFSDSSLVGGDIVSPRSLRIIDNYLVPTGFLGMPWLYGNLAKLVNSSSIIPYLTPFFAVLGILFFYLSLRFIFSQKISWLSSALLFVQPAYWYYATRTMMPNVLFLGLFFIGLYFFLRAIFKKNTISYIISGVFIGLALMTRASEIIWVLPFFALLCLFYFKRINWTAIWLMPICTIAGMLPMFYYNNILFGHPLSLGYQMQQGVEVGDYQWLSYLLPFGLNLAIIKLHAIQYIRDIFSWQFYSAVIGAILLAFSLFRTKLKFKKNVLSFLVVLVAISSILVIYYGSWVFSDNPNPNAVTIGTSFVRYWLPIYILMLGLIAIPIGRMFYKSTLAWSLISCALFLIFTNFAFANVYNDKQEGIFAIENTIKNYHQISAKVVKYTDEDAIIIAKKSDKLFFPKREVVYDLFYDIDYERINSLMQDYPVYLWDWQYSSATIDSINLKYYMPVGVMIAPVDVKQNNMQLYKLKPYERE